MCRNNKQSYWPLVLTLVLIMTLIGSYFIFPGYRDFLQTAWDIISSGDRQRMLRWVSGFGARGPVILIAAMVAQMFLIVINVVALMVIAVMAYGPWWGALLALGGIFIASNVGYWLGRYLGENFAVKLLGEKTVKKVDRMVNRYGFWAVLVARISPFLSNDAVSIVAGLLRMNYWKFLAATFSGILPLTILIAWLSNDWERMKTGLIWISAISIGALILYIIWDKWIRKKKK